MKFIAISDTHGHHKKLKLPTAEIIIHAGDFSKYDDEDSVHDFLQWFDELDYKKKILIGGNHDFLAAEQADLFQSILPDSIIYLCDSGVTINGIKIWGSPFNPDLVRWAFGEKRGTDMKKHWDLIPKDIDILITHTPPFGILDKSRTGKSQGCEELKKKLLELNPKVHMFGHIHASYGTQIIGNTRFINASNIDSRKGLVNEPVVFYLS